jgi:hypothetical protein
MFPHLYFKLCDRFALQDLALFQITVATSPSMFEFAFQNFGLDQQLNELLHGLKSRNLDPK